MNATRWLLIAALLMAVACSTPAATSPSAPTAPVVIATATATAPLPSPATTSAASPTGTPYTNTTYKFSVALPDPYRNSVRLSLDNTGGQRPAAAYAFTARTDADEAAVSGTACQTACPIWNYVAVVNINTGAGAQTPRQWYASSAGATGEMIEDTTVDGRQAIKVTNGATYPLQYFIKDGDRMFRIGELMYAADLMAVPAGASKSKLDLIMASFRFIP